MYQPVEALWAMTTPAMLISSASLLLLSTASRLGRVNDRLHHLMTAAERLSSQVGPSSAREQKQHLSLQQLTGLQGRLPLLRSAVTALYLTIAILVVTCIASAIYILRPQLPILVPISVGMLGAVAFLYSIGLLIREASIAARVTSQEITYVRHLLAEQKLLQL